MDKRTFHTRRACFMAEGLRNAEGGRRSVDAFPTARPQTNIVKEA
jgi:hypothetical protein